MAKILKMKSLILFLFLSTTFYAQQAIVSSGSTISNGASISFSIGQISVNQISNSVSSFGLGVQQPFEIMSLSLDDFQNTVNYTAYPNPTRGLFNLELKENTTFPYQLKLYDVRGRLVLHQLINKNNTPINISSQSNGVYLLQLVQSGKQAYSFKIVKN